jgi:hypothetical protein
MQVRFATYEVVRIISDAPRIKETIRNKEGIIVGMSEPNDDGSRDYGVHINEYQETFAIPEQMLVSTGRFAAERDINSRSRTARARRPKAGDDTVV